MRTENWQSNTPGLRLVGEGESGSVLSPYGPMRAGLTTSHRTNSSAFGIAQLLGERSRDPALQVLRGLRYIDRRYGTPCKAYKFSLTHRYY
jgi:hypothetical protein